MLCLHLQQGDGGWNKLLLLFPDILAHYKIFHKRWHLVGGICKKDKIGMA